MPHSISLSSFNTYEIRVHGRLDDNWLAWFGEARICFETLGDHGLVTTISGVAMDQAGLVGLIRRLHGLGIVLISVEQI